MDNDRVLGRIDGDLGKSAGEGSVVGGRASTALDGRGHGVGYLSWY
jgi:hypothetical protein